MEIEDDVYDFLRTYEKFYSDYATIYNNLDFYEDICFSTASTLFNILAKDSDNIRNISIDQLIQNLIYKKMEGSVILCNFEGRYQCHSFVIIPLGNNVIITQSFGALYAAYSDIYSITDFVELIETAFTDVSSMEKLFGFSVSGDKYQWDDVKVASRKKMHVDILPNRNVHKNKLNELRSDYLTDAGVTFSNYDADVYNYKIIDDYYVSGKIYMTKKPNAFEKIIAMYYYP